MIDATVVLTTGGASAEAAHRSLESIIDQGVSISVVIVGPVTDEVRALAAEHGFALGKAPTLADAIAAAADVPLACVSAGDVFVPGGLRAALCALDAEPSADLVYGEPCVMAADGGLEAGPDDTGPFSRLGYLLGRRPIEPTGAVARHALWTRAADTQPRATSDDELWMRLVVLAQPTKAPGPTAAVRRRSARGGQQGAAYAGLARWLQRADEGSLDLVVAARLGRVDVWRRAIGEHPGIAEAVEAARGRGLRPRHAWRVVSRRLRPGSSPSAPVVPVADEPVDRPASDDRIPLPESARSLTTENPRLVELRQRYAASGSAFTGLSLWSDEYRDRELSLARFRGDNLYVWQLRNMPEHTRLRYVFYARHLAIHDRLGLLDRLDEDGLFGCWTFDVPGMPPVSRDLLDSVREISFLDRHWGLTQRPAVSLLDIGAGYGRLAHRITTALPNVEAYYCVDGVPESTFLCEFYLEFRQTTTAIVVPVDELEGIPTGAIDLAVNVHSFSEMPKHTIEAWLDLLVDRQIRWLMIVPNDDRLLSWEADGARLDFEASLLERGFALHAREPVVRPRYLRDLMALHDDCLLFGPVDG